ncbi:iron complex outermembrane recepter protein [Methylophilus rhizosphaerae]|uniref:Iron complex outermembrane recepter protein n=1 Tax=Methylophilus rhizosphaerae TaxID=492660 RepID=A0A1G9BQZ6_9PROT|nr:TonB-dependent receptor [Methylophilus rhizosphaerae]SDK41355.1 iron complex outermembrane recepter protein [Methylophilus rhizosphaerae]
MSHPVHAQAILPAFRINQLAGLLLLSGMISMAYMPRAYAEAVQESHAALPAFNIAAGSMDQVLNAYARQTGILLVIDASLTQGKQSRGLRGQYDVLPGLNAILTGSGLQAVVQDNGSYKLQKALQPLPATAGAVDTLPEVAVSSARVAEDHSIYAGAQVARAGRAGMLGQRDFLDVPFNVTNYTAETIANQQARSIVDVLQNDPSVRQTSARTNINEDFSIRGFTVASQDIALNGMYGLAPYYRVPVEMAERVEVLKGPSALLNGMPPSGNVGGSINIVPKRAGDEALSRFGVSYMRDSVYGGTADLGRRFGENNEFGVRLNGMYRKGDTAIDQQKLEEFMGSLALDYRGERLRVTADFINQQETINKVVRQFQADTGLTKMPGAPDNQLNYPGYGHSQMKDRSMVLRGEYDVTDAMMVYAGVGRRTSLMDAVAGNPILKSTSGNYNSTPIWQLFEVKSESFEAGSRIKFDTGPIGHQVSVGATKVIQNTDLSMVALLPGVLVNSNIFSPVYIGIPSTSGFADNKTKYTAMTLTSFALADTLSFLDEKVQVTLGARQQRVEQQAYLFSTNSPYDKSALTPVGGVVFKPQENVSLYANYIEGLSQGQQAPVGASNAGQIFSPYKTKQREAGIKVDWGKLATSVSVFEIEKPSAITSGGTYSVSGEQRNRGVEFNVFGEVADGIRILGGGAYTQGELVKNASRALNGNTAVGVPDWQISLGGEWDPVPVPGLTLTSRVIYTSKQYVDQANNLSIPSITRFDIGARYKTVLNATPVTLRANIENLFNRDYWNTSNEGYIYLGMPRTLLLSATADF